MRKKSSKGDRENDREKREGGLLLPYVNFEQREQNRSLSTDQVLDLLRQWLPDQSNLAEVVGRWIRITFPEPPAENIRGQLSQFGPLTSDLRPLSPSSPSPAGGGRPQPKSPQRGRDIIAQGKATCGAAGRRRPGEPAKKSSPSGRRRGKGEVARNPKPACPALRPLNG